MSRKRKTPEERLVELILEMGLDGVQYVLTCLKILEVQDSLKWPHDRLGLAGMVKRNLTVPKVKPTRQSTKLSDTPEETANG